MDKRNFYEDRIETVIVMATKRKIEKQQWPLKCTVGNCYFNDHYLQCSQVGKTFISGGLAKLNVTAKVVSYFGRG